jgi:hypothetical protein
MSVGYESVNEFQLLIGGKTQYRTSSRCRIRAFLSSIRLPLAPSLFSNANTPPLRCRSIGYTSECLGLHVGQLHIANLGDGVGNRAEQLLRRMNSDWPSKVRSPLLLFSLTRPLTVPPATRIIR